MGADEIKRKGFNEMLGVLCKLQVELELTRKLGEKEFPVKVGRKLHREIMTAVQIATTPPSKGEKDRQGARPQESTTE